MEQVEFEAASIKTCDLDIKIAHIDCQGNIF